MPMKIDLKPGVEVYINRRNYIAIKTIEDARGEYVNVIELHPDHIDAVIEGLRKERDEFVSLGLIPGQTEPDDEA